MTGVESVEALDGQFNESLAVFDGMILTERAAAQAMGDANPVANQGDSGAAGVGTGDENGEEGDGAGGFGGPLFEEADLGDESGPGGAGGQQGEDDGGQSGNHPGGAGGSAAAGTLADGTEVQGAVPGMPGRGKGDGTVPPDLVDSSDDDIVARQIREAAMVEKDPGLREKLWDEYRKYKKGS